MHEHLMLIMELTTTWMLSKRDESIGIPLVRWASIQIKQEACNTLILQDRSPVLTWEVSLGSPPCILSRTGDTLEQLWTKV